MAGKGPRCLAEAMRALSISPSVSPAARPAFPSLNSRILPIRPTGTRCRTMATAAPASSPSGLITDPSSVAAQPRTPPWTPPTTVPVTIYDFPTMEPRSVEAWPTKHLHLPLRRDILHLAVVYEGDSTRQGTASSKTRWDVAGSHRKLYRQKGTGRARAGSKQSPLRRGGGKSHGPHPRDFSTGLNRKVYDLAWRTALSYRYRRGELFVVSDGRLDMPLPADFLALSAEGRLARELEDGYVARAVRELLDPLGWGHAGGRSTFVTSGRPQNLFTSLDVAGREARALEVDDVDVKDLLETGRIVMERSALVQLIKEHQSDLISRIYVNGLRVTGPLAGQTTTLVG